MSTTAKIEFLDGKVINLELFPQHAPKSVANFVKLAKDGFYNGLCFHRVIPNFMIQGGGFSIKDGALNPKEAERIEGEFLENKIPNPIKHEAGVISMARAMDKNSASSQFFICVADCGYLDGQYAAFGQVADKQSLEVAVEISKVKTGRWMAYDDVPREPVVIKTITILE